MLIVCCTQVQKSFRPLLFKEADIAPAVVSTMELTLQKPN
ncbi:peptidase S45 [Shewanella putrefaciens]|nr:peptidase S45 [Shewanella putrefaciens]